MPTKKSRYFNTLAEDIDRHEPELKRPKVDIDLAPPAIKKSNNIVPLCVNVGEGLYLELKTYKNSWYLNITHYRQERFVVKNRFNVSLSQLSLFQKGVDAVVDHVKKCGE